MSLEHQAQYFTSDEFPTVSMTSNAACYRARRSCIPIPPGRSRFDFSASKKGLVSPSCTVGRRREERTARTLSISVVDTKRQSPVSSRRSSQNWRCQQSSWDESILILLE